MIFQIGIGIAISISDEDRDRDRDLDFGDRGHALDFTTNPLFVFRKPSIYFSPLNILMQTATLCHAEKLTLVTMLPRE